MSNLENSLDISLNKIKEEFEQLENIEETIEKKLHTLVYQKNETSESDINEINEHIEILKSIRAKRDGVIKRLNKHEDIVNNYVNNNDLHNQNYANIQNISTQPASVESKRMSEVVNYENKRMNSHIYIFKILAVGFLFILGGLLFGGPLAIFRYIIVTLATFTILYLLIQEIYWNNKRNKLNWEQINWTDSPIIKK